MDIANLLAQGTRARPAGMEQNALMQGQEMQQRRMQNALMQMQMQAAQEKQAQDRQNALMQQQFINSIPSPQMQASQSALAGGGGPTVANAAQMKPVDQRLQLMHQAMVARMPGASPVDYINAAMPAPAKPEYKVVGDALVSVGPTGVKEAYRGAPKENADVALLRQVHGDGTPAFNAAMQALASKKTSHPSPVSVSYGAPVSGVDESGKPVFFQPAKGGGTPSIIPGVRPKAEEEKALTEGQAKAVTFSSRMLSADKTLATLNRKGVNVSVPGENIGYGVGTAVNAMSSADQQMLTQAKRDFINANLRRESGATIMPSEFDNADKQYFPQIGDSRQVIEQKAKNRRIAIEGMRADVPKAKQSDVDRISSGSAAGDNTDPLGIRGGK